MMSDHEGQKQIIELAAARCSQSRHLLRRRHSHIGMRHVRVVMRMVPRNVFTALAKPAFHERDFVFLRGFDPPGNINDARRIRPIIDKQRHLYRLHMMWDHILHEPDVIERITCVRDRRRFSRAQRFYRVSRRTRLNDGDILRPGAASHHSQSQRTRGCFQCQTKIFGRKMHPVLTLLMKLSSLIWHSVLPGQSKTVMNSPVVMTAPYLVCQLNHCCLYPPVL